VSRWRRAFDRIGGPDAVTWPAFWITFFTSATGNLTTGGSISAPLGERILILAVVQVAMFVPLVLLRFTLLRNPPRPRPWVAIGGFALAAVTRGVVLSWLLVTTGSVSDPMYAYRIASSLQSIGVMLVIVAVVVSAIREHTRALEALAAVQTELEETQARIVAEVTERSDDALDRVKSRLVEEMTALESAEGAASVVELQRLASDVVRPMSHDLAAGLPEREPDESPVQPRVTWQQVMGQMAEGAPLRSVPTAALMALFLITPSIGPLGARGLLLAAVLATSILLLTWLANAVLLRLLPRLRSTGAILATVVAGVLVGFLSAGAMALLVPDPAAARLFFLAGGVFVSVVTLVIATVAAVLREQRVSERELAERTEQWRRAVVRLRQAQWFQGKALSRALHGPVQAAVTAAALRLDAAVRAGTSTAELLPVVRSDLRAVIDVLDVDVAEAVVLDEAIARVIGTWDGLCSVSVDVDDDAHALVSSDPVLASTLVDLLTEAVSNAVRHGGASEVAVRVVLEETGLLDVEVRDDGRGPGPESRLGMGTRLLEECTLDWSRRAGSPGQVLTARIPGGPRVR
jgi:signal transduction histidine kinase